MLVKFGKIQKPSKIVVIEDKTNPNVARCIAEPFERVAGHSIGNALRRILLSSLESPGVISIRIEGVPHEFMAVDGIVEDVTHIILNVKNVLLRALPEKDGEYGREPRIVTSIIDVSQSDLDKNQGSCQIKVKDVVKDNIFEVLNPELVLFTVTKPMKRQVDLRVGYGRGYVSSERHRIPNKIVNEIVIDTSFSPVRLVNYFVENTRVGQDTDYDRLVLDITTDGRLSPKEAISFAAAIVIENLNVFQGINAETSLEFDENASFMHEDEDNLADKLMLRIDEIELSVRSTNCLTSAHIDTIAELVLIPEKRMLEFRNFGKKSLNEIKAKLSEIGLSLGMDLSAFGITQENVKEKLKELGEERKSSRDKKK